MKESSPRLAAVVFPGCWSCVLKRPPRLVCHCDVKALGLGYQPEPTRDARSVVPMCFHQADVQFVRDHETRVLGVRRERSVEALSVSAKMLMAWISALPGIRRVKLCSGFESLRHTGTAASRTATQVPAPRQVSQWRQPADKGSSQCAPAWPPGSLECFRSHVAPVSSSCRRNPGMDNENIALNMMRSTAKVPDNIHCLLAWQRHCSQLSHSEMSGSGSAKSHRQRPFAMNCCAVALETGGCNWVGHGSVVGCVSGWGGYVGT